MAGGADDKDLNPATRLVTSGRRAEWTGIPGQPGSVVSPAVWRASTHLYPDVAALNAGKPNEDGHFYYGRRGAPTRTTMRRLRGLNISRGNRPVASGLNIAETP